jgi:hypothetical protein
MSDTDTGIITVIAPRTFVAAEDGVTMWRPVTEGIEITTSGFNIVVRSRNGSAEVQHVLKAEHARHLGELFLRAADLASIGSPQVPPK